MRLALERGVNYFDTSPDYSGAGSEQAIGKAIRGPRDKLFIATKFCTPNGHLPPGTPVAEYMEAVEGSLARLGTDYVDLVHIHSCDEVDAPDGPERARGVRPPEGARQGALPRLLDRTRRTWSRWPSAAIASNRFDVMMLAYHHGIWPQLRRDDRARARASRTWASSR